MRFAEALYYQLCMTKSTIALPLEIPEDQTKHSDHPEYLSFKSKKTFKKPQIMV